MDDGTYAIIAELAAAVRKQSEMLKTQAAIIKGDTEILAALKKSIDALSDRVTTLEQPKREYRH